MLETYVIYNSILFSSIALSILYKKINSKLISKFLLILLFLILWVPASIRYGIGTDYFSYLGIFENAKTGYINTEIGYYFINIGVSLLELDPQFIFVISSFIIYFNLIASLNKNFLLTATFIAICTFYLPSYSLVRQAIAISFAGLATAQIIKGNDFRFIIFIIAGALFHTSILILIPFYFLKRVSIPKNLLIIITISASIIIYKSEVLIDVLNNSVLASTKYGYYAESKFNTSAEIGSGLGVVIKILIPMLAMIFVRNNKENNIILLFCVGSIIANVASTKIYIFNRVADTFMFLPYITLPLLLESFKLKTNRIIIIIGLLLSFGIYYERTIFTNLSINNSGLGINPYVSIFDR
ncbi:EpsG family protein [Providencia rettgeri]|uniref:EpsG family protein n=1 Tax=Providencia rettgeri TaxID=587 RepID=UPI0034E0CF74